MSDALRERFDRVPGDQRPTLGVLGRGKHDPTFRWQGSGLWRTAVTPEGSVTQHLAFDAEAVTSSTWGGGARWMTERTPDLLGANDHPEAFDELLEGLMVNASGADDPPTPTTLIADVWRYRVGPWRIPKAWNVWESTVASVLEQKVTGLEAKRAWAVLARDYGAPAPGPAPAGMVVFPTAAETRRVPSWAWRRMGVDRRRSDTIMRLAAVPHVLERMPELPLDVARARLTSIPGIGDWTFAEVAQRALGDPDAVSFGDFHLAADVVWQLTGSMQGTDEELRVLLEPFAGQRYRAVRSVELVGGHRPRRGPRMAVPKHRYG